MTGEPLRCGYVALIGAPNAGKSTLLNALVQAKVSIVTHKVQTTRSRITGIRVHGQCQIIFVDTPGILDPTKRLERAMVQAAWTGARDADRIVLVVDAARGLTDDVRRIVEGLTRARRTAIVALNKVDLVERKALLPLAATLDATGVADRIFMISASTGDGLGDLLDDLARRLPEGPWLYPEDQLSEVSERLLAAEITREKLFLRLHQELPYSLAVETLTWQERKDGSVRIDQVVYVGREGHKPIVLGAGGRTIKAIGSAARAELEAMLGRRVHLFLHVKVQPDWADDPERYRDLGLDYHA
ncbi:MAG: GTPase Era [Alphaproteobacteria bacterium]|nr:GTPase Era [Alphaproteobacteria bacterium]